MLAEKLRLTEYEGLVIRLMGIVRRQFQSVNDDNDLTPDDKRRLKEFFLDHFITTRAKAILKKHFPEDFADEARERRPGHPMNRQATP